MRLLVLGASGMLGSQVVRMAQRIDGLDVVYPTHDQVDITIEKDVAGWLNLKAPQVVINCAGIVKGRDDIENEVFSTVNGLAPQMIANLCDERDIRMVQVSTDCVFAGDGPHLEDDEPTASDIYGRSKAAGEIEMGGKHLTVRCSFVGMGQRGLLAWLGQQSGEVDGYVNVLWNGVTAPAAAQTLMQVAFRWDVTGTIHMFGPDTTKYHVLRAANEVFNLGLTIRPVVAPVADFRLRTHNSLAVVVTQDIRDQLASKEVMGDYGHYPGRA